MIFLLASLPLPQVLPTSSNEAHISYSAALSPPRMHIWGLARCCSPTPMLALTRCPWHWFFFFNQRYPLHLIFAYAQICFVVYSDDSSVVRLIFAILYFFGWEASNARKERCLDIPRWPLTTVQPSTCHSTTSLSSPIILRY